MGILTPTFQSTYSVLETRGETHLNFINTLPCSIKIFEPEIMSNISENKTLLKNTNSTEELITKVHIPDTDLLRLELGPEQNLILRSLTESSLHLSISVNETCAFGKDGFLPISNPSNKNNSIKKWTGTLQLLKSALQSFLISYQNGSVVFNAIPTPENVGKSKEGNAKLR